MLHGMHHMRVPALNIVRPGIRTLLRVTSFRDTYIYVSYDRGRGVQNHLEERLLDQAQASYTPLLGGHSRSIPQGMIFDVQPL